MENAQKSHSKVKIFSKPWVQSVAGIVVVIAALFGLLFWKSVSSRVDIEMSKISAPTIAIGPEAEGVLNEVFVKRGDEVTADEALARVGAETLYSKTAGIVIDVKNTPGQIFMPGSSVVTMIDPNELRVVGKIDENKGLSQIKVGQPATFTVDAFGGQTFTGVVDEISPTSDDTGLVFSISDKREIRQFEVKVRYDRTAHPEFKNGMSAKISVYVK